MVAIGKRVILDGIDFSLSAGSWTALVGSNGSGKTTLLRSAAGFLPPLPGLVLIRGKSLYAGEVPISALPGSSASPDALPPLLTGWQCLEVYAAARGLTGIDERTRTLAEELGYTPHLHKLVRACSLGMKQKLSVLMALMGQPAVVLLDEVFNGLDPGSSFALKRILSERVQKEGLTILLATHSLDIVARYCNQMMLLDAGRIMRVWDGAQLAALGGSEAIEAALADAARQGPGG
jgi:ABC-2 type transport system ATP-binding protein